jgi:DNA-binding CsgD family transcriptional regulator
MGDARMLDLLGDAYAALDLEEFQRSLTRGLRTAVPCDWCSVNTLGPGPGEVTALSDPPVTPPELYEVFARYAHQNPIAAHFAATGQGRPVRMSDLVTTSELHALDLYRRVYALIGLEFQVAFTLPSPAGHVLGVALSRRERDFTAADVEFLAQARPHLVQAYRNALDHTALKRQVGASPALPRADLAAFGLSPREVDVVRRVAAGLRNDDIGEQLGVSGRTVQKHLERAYRKLGVRSRSEAAKVAWRLDADRERRDGAAAPPYADSA